MNARIAYSDLGAPEAEIQGKRTLLKCYCHSLDADVYFDEKTWEIWESDGFSGSATFLKDTKAADWMVTRLHR